MMEVDVVPHRKACTLTPWRKGSAACLAIRPTVLWPTTNIVHTMRQIKSPSHAKQTKQHVKFLH